MSRLALFLPLLSTDESRPLPFVSPLSLIHDDVLDEADTRRGDLAVHKLYSNKVAVLAGDYLLARASVLLARLENVQVRHTIQHGPNALSGLVVSTRRLSVCALRCDDSGGGDYGQRPRRACPG